MPGRAVAIKRGRGGKLASKRSKTGDPACSQAMSDWKRNGMTPAIAAILGKCRSKAHHLRRASDQRLAGREGRAQALEHRADRGLTQAERTARARELVAKRREGRAAAAPKAASATPRASGRGTPDRMELAARVRSARAGDEAMLGEAGYRRNQYPGFDRTTKTEVRKGKGYYRSRREGDRGDSRYVTMHEETAGRELARDLLAKRRTDRKQAAPAPTPPRSAMPDREMKPSTRLLARALGANRRQPAPAWTANRTPDGRSPEQVNADYRLGRTLTAARRLAKGEGKPGAAPREDVLQRAIGRLEKLQRKRLVEGANRRSREDRARALDMQRRTGMLPAAKPSVPARAEPARPSVREQADAHRAKKGPHWQRQGAAYTKLQKRVKADKQASKRAEASGDLRKAVELRERALARTERKTAIAERHAAAATSKVIDVQPKAVRVSSPASKPAASGPSAADRLRDIQNRSTSMEPHAMEAAIDEVMRGVKTADVRKLNEDFLGIKLATSKKKARDLIAQRIGNFRAQQDRSASIIRGW